MGNVLPKQAETVDGSDQKTETNKNKTVNQKKNK